MEDSSLSRNPREVFLQHWVFRIEREAVGGTAGRRIRKRSIGGKRVGGIEREVLESKAGLSNRKRSVGGTVGRRIPPTQGWREQWVGVIEREAVGGTLLLGFLETHCSSESALRIPRKSFPRRKAGRRNRKRSVGGKWVGGIERAGSEESG